MPRKSLNPHLLDRLSAWGEQLRVSQPHAQQGGIQMIRREAVEELNQLAPDQSELGVRQMSAAQTPISPIAGPNFLSGSSNSVPG